MAKGNPWERKAILKELREKHGFSEEDADSIGRARNETTRLVLEKLNAVGASPEQQQEDLNTFLEAHIARGIYEQALKKEPEEYRLFLNSFVMSFISSVLIVLGALMYLGGKDLAMGAFLSALGVALIIITFYLYRQDKSTSSDNAELLELYGEDYQEAQAKLDKLLTRIGPTASAEDTQTDEELEAEVEKYLDDNF